jgi:tRNA G10  N-methylase Trm11
VPAASHPTLAAALARCAGVRADDVVWDPFVGSGLELCERGLLGPHRRLIGSDVSESALRAAGENLERAGLSAELSRGDARTMRPRDVTLVLTNPPMGRRVERSGALELLLLDFIANAARALSPGGRLVWLSPLPRATAAALESHGLSVERRGPVDVGGFDAELQLAQRDFTRQGSATKMPGP